MANAIIEVKLKKWGLESEASLGLLSLKELESCDT